MNKYGAPSQSYPWGRYARYLVLLVVAFVALLPFLWMISNAFKTNAETITRVSSNPFSALFWPTVPQWSNFVQVWLNDDFGRYFFNSFVLSSATLIGILVTSTLAGYAFAKLQFRGRQAILSVLLATLMIPEIVTMVPNFLLISAFGWVDTLPGLTVPFMASAFYIFFLSQFIRQIPDTLFDAAKIDGASHLRIIVSVVVPLTKGPLFTVIFLDLMASWNSLQWPLLVAQSPTWRPISVGLARFITEAGSQTELRMAASLIALVPIVAVFLIGQKHITETVIQTGIKG